MDAFTQLGVAAAIFVGGHFLLSSTPLRRTLVARIGEQPFRGLFSLVALASIVWMSMAYGDAVPGRTLYLKMNEFSHIPIPDDFSYFRCGRLCSDLDVLTEKKRRNMLIFQSFFEGRTSKDEYKMSCIK